MTIIIIIIEIFIMIDNFITTKKFTINIYGLFDY